MSKLFNDIYFYYPSLTVGELAFSTRNIDGKNILYVNPDRQYKDWYKKIKYCINNPNHVKDMGEAAYELACKKYDIDVLSHIRADFYRGLVKQEKLELV
jgi:glycosyltransferase involved in cell wall biosynthesis